MSLRARPAMPIELFFTEFGTGPPIIILHGLFGSGTNWRSIARRLGESHRVLVVDQRNHGSSPHTETMSYPAMAADVRTLMDNQGLAQATLLGHSLGGKVAMMTALAYPKRVERLIIIDIAPVRYAWDHSELIEAMRRVDLGKIRRRGDADAQLQPRIPDPQLRLFLLHGLANRASRFRWRMNLDSIEAAIPTLSDFPETTPGIRYPGETLFLRGEKSDYILPDHHEVIRRRFPNAEFQTIRDTGHWVHAAQPLRFLAAVQDFLRRHSRP